VELGELGFSLIVSPLSGLLAMTKALGDAYARLRALGTMRDGLGDMAGFDEFTDLVGLPKHLANESTDR
jgi:2-methylisocitrate lyase-like PEP mutase family enzyme